ncbi:hypothetical protein Vadar_025362 [Vaccinium darrowii]|uniref:Uncharacterized protein n=1 Tax=Vaccinium darrowii TaxID=229202 RepID=A0ACB7XUH9_9ERIC|nr:hypothetical protein Vadar_025362 [Vaccinium darrowii]
MKSEQLNHCPVCDAYLGCKPLQELSPDPTVQDIRDKILNPSTRIKKSEDSKPGPSNPPPAFINLEETEDNLVPLPARRKQRSLSSLVGQPKALNQTVTTGRNMTPEKAGKRYPSRGSSLWIKEPTEEDVRRRSSPPLSLRKFTQPRKRTFHAAQSSKGKMPQKGADDPVVKPLEGTSDMWKPLNCLVEAADMTRLENPTMPVLVKKSEPSSIHSGAPPTNKMKSKERRVHFKDDEGRASNLEPSGLAKHKNVCGVQRGKDAASGNIAPQAMVNAASTMCYEEVHPIWFSLVASDSQEGDAPLQQIPSGYLRVKNANLPVCFIQKYIAKKLNLYSEAEVEITMQGYIVPPNLPLHNLINLWSQRAPKSEIIKTAVGCSAEDFVMSYLVKLTFWLGNGKDGSFWGQLTFGFGKVQAVTAMGLFTGYGVDLIALSLTG